MRLGIGAIAAAAIVAFTAGCGEDDAEGGDTQTIRFAVTDLTGLEELQREYGAFVEAFEAESGQEMEFFPVVDRVAAAAALESDRVDMVFTGPAEYVVMRARTDAEPVVSINRPDYHSCVYTNADSEFESLEDLTGEKIAMSDVGSTSGHLGPSQMFADAGIEMPGGVEALTVGDAFHQALVRGDVAAVGIGCHDYEEAMQSEDDPSEYRVIAEGDLLPADVIIARPELDDETIESVRSIFEESWEDVLLPAMLEGKDNQKYDGATLEPAPEDSDYDAVREMYRTIGVEDFTEFAGS
ncbi:MAG: PhnD/SsuA/transferrin family substrate-binding protein [Solirubrobacterales bacterium]